MAKNSEFIIRYRSGAEMRVTADSLEMKWEKATGDVVEMKWETMRPRPIYVGIANIESVWEVVI